MFNFINFVVIATALCLAGEAQSADRMVILKAIIDLKEAMDRLDYRKASRKDCKGRYDDWQSCDWPLWTRRIEESDEELIGKIQWLDSKVQQWTDESVLLRGSVDFLSAEEAEDWGRELLSQIFPDGKTCSYDECETRIWDVATRPRS